MGSFGFCTVRFYRLLKVRDSPADAFLMTPFSAELWLLLGLIAFGAVLAVLGRMAGAIEEGKHLHDVKVTADRLRRQYAAQLAAQQGDQELGEVDIVEDEPAVAKAA